jgi:hypothetical protein
MKAIKTLSLTLVFALSISFAHAQNNINNITTAYLALKNALAAGNSSAAQGKAKDLLVALSAPETSLNPGQKKVFDTYAEKLKYDSRHIFEVGVIDHQREHFESLSKNMYEVLKGTKANTTPVYYQYCPMKKAYWLSESATIKNPYYSDKEMSTCGSTKVTLAAVK